MKGAITVLMIPIFMIFLLLAGCGVKCDAPYKLIDGVCCTDENDNGECDIEELEEKESQKDDSFKMDKAEYDDTGIDLPDPEYEEPTYEEVSVREEVPPRETRPIYADYPDEDEPTPSIDDTYDVKKSTTPSEGMKPAVVVKKTPEVFFEVSNVRYGQGTMNRFDINVSSNLDYPIEPRVYVHALDDGELRMVQEAFLSKIYPGTKRFFENVLVNEDMDRVDQTVKFELVYHTSHTGFVSVGEQQMFLEKK